MVRLTPARRAHLKARAAQMRDETAREARLQEDLLRIALPDLARHSEFSPLARFMTNRASGDYGRCWHEEVVAWVRARFATLESLEPETPAALRLSAKRCRVALGETGAKLTDPEVEFLRDQLYTLAESLVSEAGVIEE